MSDKTERDLKALLGEVLAAPPVKTYVRVDDAGIARHTIDKALTGDLIHRIRHALGLEREDA